jgi:RimJ/RimL family protein N-acetyltransferase
MIQFDLQPRLAGELIELRPMRPEDWRDLYAVAADPLIWEVHPARDRYKEERFREYFEEALQSGGALVALDRRTGRIIGASRYYWYGPAKTELEIGWTFLARSYWGGIYNGEMKRLMLDYVLPVCRPSHFPCGNGQHTIPESHEKDRRCLDRTPRPENSPRNTFRIRSF